MAHLSALVLAGGAGLRLRSRVPSLPKPMAPVGGRPFLEYVLDRLLAGGVRDIVLCLGYRADAVQAHFAKGYRDARLRFEVEAEPLGTGGAIAAALRGAPEEPALVLNGDTYVQIDYAELARWYASDPVLLAMVAVKTAQPGRYGSLALDGERVRGFAEKSAASGWTNAGIYMLRAGVFARFGLAGSFSLEHDLLERHAGELGVRAFRAAGYFIDIGVPEDYERAQKELPALA